MPRLLVGDAVDWCRVEEIQDLKLLRLRAEMRVPGQAWLERIVDHDAGAVQGGTCSGSAPLFIPTAWPVMQVARRGEAPGWRPSRPEARPAGSFEPEKMER